MDPSVTSLPRREFVSFHEVVGVSGELPGSFASRLLPAFMSDRIGTPEEDARFFLIPPTDPVFFCLKLHSPRDPAVCCGPDRSATPGGQAVRRSLARQDPASVWVYIIASVIFFAMMWVGVGVKCNKSGPDNKTLIYKSFRSIRDFLSIEGLEVWRSRNNENSSQGMGRTK